MRGGLPCPSALQVCMVSRFEIGDDCVPFVKCWMTMRLGFEVATSGSATTNVAAFSVNLLQTTHLPNREVLMELQAVLPSGWALVPAQTLITSQQGLLFKVVARACVDWALCTGEGGRMSGGGYFAVKKSGESLPPAKFSRRVTNIFTANSMQVSTENSEMCSGVPGGGKGQRCVCLQRAVVV